MTKTGKFIWITFALLIVAVYLFGLTIPLVGPDEPRYSQIAREMYERGDWITPKLGGFDWFEKPVLLYWLQIASYKLFGVNEFAARFGSALFGLGTVASVWLLGRFGLIQNEKGDERSSTEYANWLALIAASSIGLIAFSRGASFDIILTFPISAALVAYFLFDRWSAFSGPILYFLLFVFYFFVGAALLAKGLVGVVFPFAIIAFYHVLKWELVPSAKFCFSLIWGIPLILLVAATWYVPMYQVNGWKFIDEFIIQHHFQRYTSNKYQHPQPIWFFWVVLPLMTIPWLPFFAASAWNFLKVQTSKFRVQSEEKISPLALFCFAWLLVPLVFFSLSGSKLPGYILPALPAALVLTGNYVYKFVQRSKLRVVAVQGLAFGTFAVVVILLQAVVPNFVAEDTTKYLMKTANERGFREQKLINLHTVSHNAEFYAPGRIVRADDGKIRKFLGDLEVRDYLNRTSEKSVLVLVPLEFLAELENSRDLKVEVLDRNSELAIAAAEPN